MHKLTITGAYDELIGVSGDIRKDFIHARAAHEQGFLSVSDGTVLRVVYDGDGIWRFPLIFRGSSFMSKTDGNDDTPDVIELTSDKPFTWILFGNQLAIGRRP